MNLADLIELYKGLLGFAALIAAIVNAAKKIGLIPDGYAGLASLVLNLVGLVVTFAVVYFGGDVYQWDSVAKVIADLLGLLIVLSAQIGMSYTVHRLLADSGIPIIGHRH